MCTHGGTAQPLAADPRVLVSGMPVVTISSPYIIAGCGLTTSGGPFCITGQWVSSATKVLASGVPVILIDSAGVCPPGTMQTLSAQTKVTAT